MAKTVKVVKKTTSTPKTTESTKNEGSTKVIVNAEFHEKMKADMTSGLKIKDEPKKLEVESGDELISKDGEVIIADENTEFVGEVSREIREDETVEEFLAENLVTEEPKQPEFQGNEPIILKPTLGSKLKLAKPDELQDSFNAFLDICRRNRFAKLPFEQAARTHFSGLNVTFRYPNPTQCFLSIEGNEFNPHIQLAN